MCEGENISCTVKKKKKEVTELVEARRHVCVFVSPSRSGDAASPWKECDLQQHAANGPASAERHEAVAPLLWRIIRRVLRPLCLGKIDRVRLKHLL